MRGVVIADDEPLARKRLRMMLAPYAEYEIVAECRDGPETVTALVEHAPDVVFLDVQMPGLDGFEVLTAIEDRARPPALVFVTAFANHAVQAFDSSAADFLLKPFDAERFERAMRRVEARLTDAAASDTATVRRLLQSLERPTSSVERFLVRGVNHLYFVRTIDVEWIDSASNYVRLHVGGRVHFLRETIKGIVGRLPGDRFVRVHRSAIVNLDFVQRLEPQEHGEYLITMRDGSRLTSSRSYNDELRTFLRSAR